MSTSTSQRPGGRKATAAGVTSEEATAAAPGALPLPQSPTRHRPGSPGKIAVLRGRAERGESLHHPGDFREALFVPLIRGLFRSCKHVPAPESERGIRRCGKSWRATIRRGETRVELGYFRTFHEAKAARRAWLFGERQRQGLARWGLFWESPEALAEWEARQRRRALAWKKMAVVKRRASRRRREDGTLGPTLFDGEG